MIHYTDYGILGHVTRVLFGGTVLQHVTIDFILSDKDYLGCMDSKVHNMDDFTW